MSLNSTHWTFNINKFKNMKLMETDREDVVVCLLWGCQFFQKPRLKKFDMKHIYTFRSNIFKPPPPPPPNKVEHLTLLRLSVAPPQGRWAHRFVQRQLYCTRTTNSFIFDRYFAIWSEEPKILPLRCCGVVIVCTGSLCFHFHMKTT